MASFSLPSDLPTGPDGNWGPPASSVPPQFVGIPYTPFSKADKLGRVADWNADAGRDDRSATGGGGGQRKQNQRYAQQANYGASASNAFAYFHGDDEGSFSIVDNARATSKRGGLSGFQRGRGRGGAGGGPGGGRGGRGGFGRGGAQGGQRGGFQGRRRFGWKDWDRPQRTREPSVTVGPEWELVEEIDFTRLAKLRLDVDDAEDITSYGTLYPYDKTYDRINSTKFEKPLQILDRIRYNPTTSDDPIIQDLAARNKGTIFITDSILSLLMCATRSIYPWDIIMVKTTDGKLFLDKRDGGPFDFVTVNENAADPPMEPTDGKDIKDHINSPSALSLEATYVNQNFAFQVVNENLGPIELQNANPFYSPDEQDPLASCGYRYRRFDLSTTEEEDVQLVVRTEVDSVVPGANGEANQYITIKTLNEFDSRAQGAGGAPDWRKALDSQRGAVVATEMKNNSCKLARWAVQSILAGAENMKMGYVSRASPRDAARHVILGTQSYKPRDFAAQMNLNLANGWGIVRTVCDLAMRAPEGKYVLVKDPNRPVVRLYSVPAAWPEQEGEEEGMEGDAEEVPMGEE